MIANIYLTKVLKSPHKIESILTRTGMATAITLTDLNITIAVMSIDASQNNIQVGIDSDKWNTLSNYLLTS